MIVTQSVKIHTESEDYLKRIFDNYTEVYELPAIINEPIIHIYPKKDTCNEDGELDGYIDAIFSEVHIYDTVEMKVYKGESLHDALMPSNQLDVWTIRIFKDLSTLVGLRGKYRIGMYTAVSITKLD